MEFEQLGVVVVAAGRSSRFGSTQNKLLIPLQGTPLFCHCLKTFLKIVPAKNIILVTAKELQNEFQTIMAEQNICGVRIAFGGKERQDSVLNGITALAGDLKYVAVHDAARPFTTLQVIKDCCETCFKKGSGVAAKRVVNTIKIADKDGKVNKTLDRDKLWSIETPQLFTKKILLDAYENVKKQSLKITDDAQAVELLGEDIFLVENHTHNDKITYQLDLATQ